MSLIVWLQTLRMVAFVVLAALTFDLWRRRRGRPELLLMGCFGLLALVLVLSRVSPTADGVFGRTGRDLTVLSLLWVPWLLAAFAWSFEGSIPRWLRAAAQPLAAISVWKIALAPLPPPGQPREGIFVWFTVAFIGSWTILMLAACYRLWNAGGPEPLVRSRMRTMAAGAFALNVALLAAGWVRPEGTSGGYLAILAVSLLAAALFLLGFAPPQALREWWRRRAYAGWQQMQTELIAATSPRQVAEAVIPMLAEVAGGSVAVLARSGLVLADRGFGAQELATMRGRVEGGDVPADHDHVFTAENCWLVLRPTQQSPLFGEHEVAMIEGFTLHLRLALERAELYEANLEALRELERAGQNTEQMLIGLGHDLRSPAMTVAGLTELLLADPEDPERDELLDGLAESAAYLNRLVDALLELSSVGRRELATENVDLHAVLDRALPRLLTAYPSLRTVVPQPLPRVTGTSLGFEQVFDNLLTNAVKHGDRTSITVTIEWATTGTGIRLTVSDDGCGITDDDREHVFAPFRRGCTSSNDGNGVGLGLVRRIIESVGGSIQLVDDPENSSAGAVFVIDLLAPSELTDPGCELTSHELGAAGSERQAPAPPLILDAPNDAPFPRHDERL